MQNPARTFGVVVSRIGLGLLAIIVLLVLLLIISKLFPISSEVDKNKNNVVKATDDVSDDAKANFRYWAKINTSVTYLEYPDNSDFQIWVMLKPEEYNSKDNLKKIAHFLSKSYKEQTGFRGVVTVTVWSRWKKEIVAKGKS